MKTLLRTLASGLVLLMLAPGYAADVPLTGPPAATFGPAPLDVVVAGVGLVEQPATFSVTIPGGATVAAAYLYVTGRGAGDGTIVLNGMTVSLSLVASGGPLPFDATQSIETRRMALTLGSGTSTFTITGYGQAHPGGAFVVAVVNDPTAPVRTVTLLEGADYAFHGFAPPYGPDTATAPFSFSASSASRAARLIVFTHDTQANRGDATWVQVAASGTVLLPPVLVGGAGGAVRVQRNLLGERLNAGGFSRGAQLDLFDRDVAVPAGADYLAFQIESPENEDGDSLGLSVAVLSLPAPDTNGGGGSTTTSSTLYASSTSTTLSGSSTSTTLFGSSTSTTLFGSSTSTTLFGSSTSTTLFGSSTSTTLPSGVPFACGDGVLDSDEECDDGNRVSGDGCDASCAAEETAETWKLSLRVRPEGEEKLRYFTTLPALPPALLGTAPFRITLAARGFQMLDAELPASVFKVKARPNLAQPDGRRAVAEGEFGIWRVRVVLKPVTGRREYTLKLIAEGEMLPEMFGILHLTATFRLGNVVYTATDPLKANHTGKFLRYIHPVIDD